VEWRRSITSFLQERGIVVLDPTQKPISQLDAVPSEIGEEKRMTQALKDAGKFDEYRVIAKKIRSVDLRMTDIADFLVVYVDKSIPMCGTWEELFNANRQKKPILVFIEGGAKEASLWLHGTIHYKYIFENLGEVKSFIAAIDDGIVQMDGRWQLLDHVKLGDVPRPPMPEKLKRLFDTIIEYLRNE
jgi:hypothetical protein